jgi:hypothetical protein
MDPISAIAIATTAFEVIKKGISFGKDVESMYSDVGRWMGAISDLEEADRINKKPPLFKKIFDGSSIEQEAMEIFAARKKAEQMQQELKTFINMAHGPAAWGELLALQGKIRKDRQKRYNDQAAQKKEIINAIGVGILMIGGGVILITGGYIILDIMGKI